MPKVCSDNDRASKVLESSDDRKWWDGKCLARLKDGRYCRSKALPDCLYCGVHTGKFASHSQHLERFTADRTTSLPDEQRRERAHLESSQLTERRVLDEEFARRFGPIVQRRERVKRQKGEIQYREKEFRDEVSQFQSQERHVIDLLRLGWTQAANVYAHLYGDETPVEDAPDAIKDNFRRRRDGHPLWRPVAADELTLDTYDLYGTDGKWSVLSGAKMSLKKDSLIDLPTFPSVKWLSFSNFKSDDIGHANLEQILGAFPNLERLDMWFAQDLGLVPKPILGMTQLKYLFLDGNLLSELPSEIGNLTNLKLLSLGSNNLTSLPAAIGRLTNLEHLELGEKGTSPDHYISVYGAYGRCKGNRIKWLPQSVVNLTNLTYLNLYTHSSEGRFYGQESIRDFFGKTVEFSGEVDFRSPSEICNSWLNLGQLRELALVGTSPDEEEDGPSQEEIERFSQQLRTGLQDALSTIKSLREVPDKASGVIGEARHPFWTPELQRRALADFLADTQDVKSRVELSKHLQRIVSSLLERRGRGDRALLSPTELAKRLVKSFLTKLRAIVDVGREVPLALEEVLKEPDHPLLTVSKRREIVGKVQGVVTARTPRQKILTSFEEIVNSLVGRSAWESPRDEFCKTIAERFRQDPEYYKEIGSWAYCQLCGEELLDSDRSVTVNSCSQKCVFHTDCLSDILLEDDRSCPQCQGEIYKGFIERDECQFCGDTLTKHVYMEPYYFPNCRCGFHWQCLLELHRKLHLPKEIDRNSCPVCDPIFESKSTGVASDWHSLAFRDGQMPLYTWRF
jgi:hypothetical protein